MNRKLIVVILTLVVVCVHSFSQVYTVQSVPDPKISCADCWVSNPDSIIETHYVDNMNLVAKMLKQDVNVELAVVAINAFDEDRYADAFSFAQELFNTWGIGGSEKNTGVLVFFASQSRDIRIHTGGGMEGLLPDILCDQILDDNIDALSEGDYGKGLLAIVCDIGSILVTPEAQAELLLDYKPQSIKFIQSTCDFFYAAIIAFLLVYIFAYKRWNSKDDSSRQALIKRTQAPQNVMGCLSLVFPIPMLFLFMYFLKKRKGIRTDPYPCPKCATKMTKLSGIDSAIYLSPMQVTENKIGAKSIDVWLCPECGTAHAESYDGDKASKYEQCPSCGAKALELVSSVVLQHATYSHSGTRQLTYKCVHCGKTRVMTEVIPMLDAASTSSGRSYSSGSGSYSSGRSSGSSGGSWVGGSSFGGGAGHKF